ncbi:hypothetical protein [uncultured Methanomethylovorans sp.]|uniref:hypothetical protein n=1 Tax=uncultured Methanomethylovorans sp. TaxID=183759 RepID=UPI002AA8F506|nr:hypothetical protein [uncultured Methanomethylovorans sp.]
MNDDANEQQFNSYGGLSNVKKNGRSRDTLYPSIYAARTEKTCGGTIMVSEAVRQECKQVFEKYGSAIKRAEAAGTPGIVGMIAAVRAAAEGEI